MSKGRQKANKKSKNKKVLSYWDKRSNVTGYCITYVHPTSLQAVAQGCKLEQEPKKNILIKIARDPYVEKENYLAYHGLEITTVAPIDVDFKEYKVGDTVTKCQIASEMQSLAGFLAQEFMDKASADMKLLFSEMKIVQLRLTEEHVETMTSEKPLNGQLIHLPASASSAASSNAKERELIDLFAALCHWTYEITGGYLMITSSSVRTAHTIFVS